MRHPCFRLLAALSLPLLLPSLSLHAQGTPADGELLELLSRLTRPDVTIRRLDPAAERRLIAAALGEQDVDDVEEIETIARRIGVEPFDDFYREAWAVAREKPDVADFRRAVIERRVVDEDVEERPLAEMHRLLRRLVERHAGFPDRFYLVSLQEVGGAVPVALFATIAEGSRRRVAWVAAEELENRLRTLGIDVSNSEPVRARLLPGIVRAYRIGGEALASVGRYATENSSSGSFDADRMEFSLLSVPATGGPLPIAIVGTSEDMETIRLGWAATEDVSGLLRKLGIDTAVERALRDDLVVFDSSAVLSPCVCPGVKWTLREHLDRLADLPPGLDSRAPANSGPRTPEGRSPSPEAERLSAILAGVDWSEASIERAGETEERRLFDSIDADERRAMDWIEGAGYCYSEPLTDFFKTAYRIALRVSDLDSFMLLLARAYGMDVEDLCMDEIPTAYEKLRWLIAARARRPDLYVRIRSKEEGESGSSLLIGAQARNDSIRIRDVRQSPIDDRSTERNESRARSLWELVASGDMRLMRAGGSAAAYFNGRREEERRRDLDYLREIGRIIHDNPLPDFAETVVKIVRDSLKRGSFQEFAAALGRTYGVDPDDLEETEVGNAYARTNALLERMRHDFEYYLVTEGRTNAPWASVAIRRDGSGEIVLDRIETKLPDAAVLGADVFTPCDCAEIKWRLLEELAKARPR